MRKGTPALEDLKIFWSGTEVPGLIFYGIRPRGDGAGFELGAGEVFPGSEEKPFRLFGEAWEIIGWDVRVQRWPVGADWHPGLRAVLQRILDHGCAVAWMGVEGLPFGDPPYLFTTEWMEGGVLAGLTPDGLLYCHFDISEPLVPLPSAEMAVLRSASRGLADAS